MKEGKMPTTVILLFFSWLVAFIGLAWPVAQTIIFGFNHVNVLINSATVLLVSLLLAVIIRMFANIGQMVFDFKSDLQKIASFVLKDLPQGFDKVNSSIEEINSSLDKAGGDIKEIKKFYEAIEKHLDLKKE